MKPLKIAFVYDRVNKLGGAERVLTAFHDIWPDAPLYTAVYDSVRAQWAHVFLVKPSFLGHFPFAKHHHEFYPWLTPMAFESFSFDEYDVVISVTSAEAKDIITKPQTLHVCYCLTPTRYLWSGYDLYRKNPAIGIPNWITAHSFEQSASLLRRWDLIASTRPDAYIAISKIVATRIQMYYQKQVDKIIYPPVDIETFSYRKKKNSQKDDYFLVVSRLVPYKRMDVIIDAFNELGWPLIIVGDGFERTMLESRAKQNIRFVGELEDQELVHYYRSCRGYVAAAEEDFGIAAVEAQACGKPVIAYQESGISEVVRAGQTGLLFDHQSSASLVSALKMFNRQCYDSASCVANAKRFSTERFKKEMKGTVEALYNRYI